MKATICRNSELSVADLPDPTPSKGQVLVDVLRCGICGSDLHARYHCDHMKQLMGKVGYAKNAPSKSDAVVFGHEYCCEVLEYGPDCERKLKPGTRVVAQPLLRNGGDIDIIGMSVKATG